MSLGNLPIAMPHGRECTLSAPIAQKHRVHAELKAMMQRGEIAYAFNPRTIENGKTYAVDYVRIAEPPKRTGRLAAISLAAIGAPITIGGMVWHSRHVLLAAAETAGAIALGAVVISYVLGRIVAGRPSHCPGAFHK